MTYQNHTNVKQFETVEEHLAYYMGKCEVLEMIIHAKAPYSVIAPPPVIYPPLQTPQVPSFNTGNNGGVVNINQTNEVPSDENNTQPGNLRYHVVPYTEAEIGMERTMFEEGVKLISTFAEGKHIQPGVDCKYVMGVYIERVLNKLARGQISHHEQALEIVANKFIESSVLYPLFNTSTPTKIVTIVTDSLNDVLDENLLRIMKYIDETHNVTTRRTTHTGDKNMAYTFYTFINQCK